MKPPFICWTPVNIQQCARQPDTKHNLVISYPSGFRGGAPAKIEFKIIYVYTRILRNSPNYNNKSSKSITYPTYTIGNPNDQYGTSKTSVARATRNMQHGQKFLEYRKI